MCNRNLAFSEHTDQALDQDAHHHLSSDGVHPRGERGARGERGQPEHIRRVRSFQGIRQQILGHRSPGHQILVNSIRNPNIYHGAVGFSIGHIFFSDDLSFYIFNLIGNVLV